MALKTELANMVSSLETYSSKKGRVSAHSPIELVKESGIPEAMYFMKILPSTVSVYTGAEKAENEIYGVEVMSFVKCSDSIEDKEVKYNLMLDMSDDVKDWVYETDPQDVDSGINKIKYKGISRVQDDRLGFYALMQRIEFETYQ
jgi:hypothetical protein